MSPTLIWSIVGVALLVLELVSGSFTVLFFAVSAFLVVGARLLGLNDWLIEGGLFAILGVLGLALFRRRVTVALSSVRNSYKADQNQTVQITADIQPGDEGKIDYQGSTWTGVNLSTTPLLAGEKAVILKTEGIKLYLQKKEG